MTGAPPGAQLIAGPSWLVQRIGRNWYVRIDWGGQAHWSEPYASRAIAESMLDKVRASYAEHMERHGFGTVMVDVDKPGGAA